MSNSFPVMISGEDVQTVVSGLQKAANENSQPMLISEEQALSRLGVRIAAQALGHFDLDTAMSEGVMPTEHTLLGLEFTRTIVELRPSTELVDQASTVAIDALVNTGFTGDDQPDSSGVTPVGDKLQSLLMLAFLRSPELLVYIERAMQRDTFYIAHESEIGDMMHYLSKPDNQRPMLVCRGCGEAFDHLVHAQEHGAVVSGTDWCGDDGFDILSVTEAM